MVTMNICFGLFLLQVILFPVLKSAKEFSTQTYQYTWFVSGSLMSGNVPVVVLAVMGIFATAYFAFRTFSDHSNILAIKFSDDKLGEYFESTTIRTNIAIVLFLLIEFAGLLCVNVLYVLLKDSARSQTELIFVQFALALVNQYIQNFQVRKYVKFMTIKLGIRELWVSVIALSVIVLFEVTVAPSFSVILLSRNCLYDAVFGTELEDAPYPLPFCVLRDDSFNCLSQIFQYQSLSFPTPLIYNNDCRNDILSVFVPVLLLSYAFMFAYPLVAYIFLAKHTNPRKTIHPKILSIVGSMYWPQEKVDYSPFKFVHSPPTMMMKQNLFIGVALTIGFTSPPLLVAIGLTSFVTYYMHHVVMVRYIKECPHPDMLALLDQNCLDAWRCPYYFLWPAIINSYIFQTLFLMDMAGDTDSVLESMWIPILLFICLGLLRVVFYQREKTVQKDVEMRVSKSHLEIETRGASVSVSDNIPGKQVVLRDASFVGKNHNTSTTESSTSTENPIYFNGSGGTGLHIR